MLKKEFDSIKINMAVLFVFFSFYLLSTKNAFSYIDPGTGSYVFQILIASVLGILTLTKIYWSRLKVFFVSVFTKQSNNEAGK